MAGHEIEARDSDWPERGGYAAVSFGAMAALLILDGQLGPLSFTLRRAIALAVLAAIAVPRFVRAGRGQIARWAGAVAAIVLMGRVPSVPMSLVAFLVGLAAIEAGADSAARAMRLTIAVVPACLAYVGYRFASDLVPQTGAITQTVARYASAYINRVRGFDDRLSFTALGGPAIALAVLYLVWSWRRAGGVGRLVAASTLPLAWFALVPVVTPDVSAGPLAVFFRGAGHGLFWLALAAFAGARPPGRRGVPHHAPSSATRKLPLAAAGMAAALAGVCVVGTGLIAPAAGRSIRVHNHGGLDWDRPVFGQFGAFSGGMFGLLPVYCRAEGYDFDVIGHTQEDPSGNTRRPTYGSGPAPARANATLTKGHQGLPRTSKGGTGGASPDGREVRRSADRIAVLVGAASALASAVAPPAKVVSRPTDTIERGDLAGTQILVLINSPKEWKDAERRMVLDFVAQGGSLLVLGDHTDVFGLMRGFNSLLAPLGIRFRFDSAYKARHTWRGCQAAAPDAVAMDWDDENPGVAVGSSLELSGNARPLLVGRYAFSDVGMRENTIGSFLGNYHYDRGEQLGDVVLVATVTHGRGRIVVWGDTSAFQGGLSSSYRKLVSPVLAWLSRPPAWTELPPVRVAAAVALLAALLWTWIVPLTPKQIAVLAVSLLLGLAVPWALSLRNMDGHPHVDRNTILIDRSHMEATGHYEARINPIGPLYTNLLRSGFRVFDMDRWDSAAIGRAQGIAFVAPQRSFTRGEVDELLRAEENGAIVILATGEPDSAGSRPLLQAHGLALVPRPLGTVPSAEPTASRLEREQQPRFLDAWPIVAAGEGDPTNLPGVDVIYRDDEDVVALFRRIGRGGLLAISDTRFFSDMNVEGMSGYWVGNLAFIHDVFQRYLGADPEAVKPLFRSPEKPQ